MLAGAPQTLLSYEVCRLDASCRVWSSLRYDHPGLLTRWTSWSGKGKRRCSASVSIRAGYKRIPMEASGAYQLIDDDTGDKVIVWGNADDPIPSPEVLSWKPLDSNPRKGDETTKPTAEGTNTPMSHVGSTVGSFSSLKAQHIRRLVKKSSSSIGKGNAHHEKGLSSDDNNLARGIRTNSKTRNGGSKAMSGQVRKKESENDLLVREEPYSMNFEDNIPNEDVGDVDRGKALSKVTASPSRGWSGARAVQSATAGRFKQLKRMDQDSGFFSRKLFRDLCCNEDMLESLRRQHFTRPSHIQTMAYGPILERKSCIIADQSGSGKTLAYLAPIVQQLRQEELLGLGKSSARNPRVVILVPTAELASQVLGVCRSMAKSGVQFRSVVVTGGFRQKTQLESLQQELDILIATPGRFAFLLEEGFVQLHNLKCIVLDEVDILFGDEGYEQVLQTLISSAPMTTQYLFVTATLPIDIYNKVVEVFPDCEVIMGPGLHRTSSGLEEALVDCSGENSEEKNPETAFQNKKSALFQIIEESPVSKTIVFCNKIETCRKVENALKRFDRKGFSIRVLPFHAAIDQELRLLSMKEFLSSQSKDSLFLICTDRASRGIDFAGVDHVILFDFPRDPSEYVRRVGRTARGAGGRGKAFVFVVGKQVSLARRIMERNQKGHPLHDVPSAYEVESSVI